MYVFAVDWVSVIHLLLFVYSKYRCCCSKGAAPVLLIGKEFFSLDKIWWPPAANVYVESPSLFPDS